MRRAALACVLAATLAGCGGHEGEASGEALVVSAASSLTKPLQACSPDGTRLSFAGSDELAGQIRRGVKPGVFAAANTELPEQLYAEGLVERPRVFATNRLVIAVPHDSEVDAIEELAADGVDIAVGAPDAPVGAYTRDVLGRMPSPRRQAIERNIRSEEPDVRGVVGKLTQGAADAGFVYASDVTGAENRLRAVELPANLEPEVRYGVAVVKGSRDPEAARRYVDGLVDGPCARALGEAGFGPPPSS